VGTQIFTQECAILQARGYFVSDQAENEAKLHHLETLTRARKDKYLLEGKLKSRGKVLSDFAEVLRHPRDFVFDMTKESITVGQPGGQRQRPVAQLTQPEMDWNDLWETINGYINAKQDERDSSAALGLPIPE
jgi:hypothetical protein